MEKNLNRGALWKREGKFAFIGRINIDGINYKLRGYKNKYKKNETHPDFTLRASQEPFDSFSTEEKEKGERD